MWSRKSVSRASTGVSWGLQRSEAGPEQLRRIEWPGEVETHLSSYDLPDLYERPAAAVLQDELRISWKSRTGKPLPRRSLYLYGAVLREAEALVLMVRPTDRERTYHMTARPLIVLFAGGRSSP